MPLIYDLIEPQAMQGFVRSLTFPDLVLDSYLPNLEIPDIEFAYQKAITGADGALLNDEDVATYRAMDTEAPIARRHGLGTPGFIGGPPRIRGQIPPISRKIRLGEEERLRMDALRTGDRAAIIDSIFNDAARLTRSIQARVEVARAEALVDGTVTINENGIYGTLDFGRPAGNNVVAPTPWTDPTALVIDDALGWQQYYRDLNGRDPATFLTSTRVVAALLRNNQIRALAGGLAPTPAIVTPDTVAAVFRAYGLPVPEAYDTALKIDGVVQRLIPEDVMLVLPPRGTQDLGKTFYGVTAEALELQSEGKIVSRQAPGLVGVIEKTFDPVATWTKVAGLALPVVTAPSLVMKITVGS